MSKSKYREGFEHYFHEKMGFKILADEAQYEYVKAILAPTNEVQAVFCDSKAGTGKSALALASAYYLLEKEEISKIIYVRNTVSVRENGFLRPCGHGIAVHGQQDRRGHSFRRIQGRR